MQKYYERLQIHSTPHASFSTEDELLYKEVDSPSRNNEDLTNEVNISYTELKSKSNLSKSKMNTIVEGYLEAGYTKDIPKNLALAFKKVKEEEEKQYYIKSQKIGRVFKYLGNRKITKEEVQGGFSDELFNQEYIQNYIQNPNAIWGYIGGLERLIHVDKQLEKTALQYLNKKDAYKLLSIWVCSSPGRHFCDNIDENTKITKKTIESIIEDVNSFNNVKKTFKITKSKFKSKNKIKI